jgi:hypothetical protein
MSVESPEISDKEGFFRSPPPAFTRGFFPD